VVAHIEVQLAEAADSTLDLWQELESMIHPLSVHLDSVTPSHRCTMAEADFVLKGLQFSFFIDDLLSRLTHFSMKFLDQNIESCALYSRVHHGSAQFHHKKRGNSPQ
jgi:hypothetical protein